MGEVTIRAVEGGQFHNLLIRHADKLALMEDWGSIQIHNILYEDYEFPNKFPNTYQ